MPNGDLSEWNNLRLLDKLISEVKDDEDRDIDVRRNERFVVPATLKNQRLRAKRSFGKGNLLSFNENGVSTSQKKDNERGQG
jgi:hypothetical protein